jgi:hypothetical protein
VIKLKEPENLAEYFDIFGSTPFRMSVRAPTVLRFLLLLLSLFRQMLIYCFTLGKEKFLLILPNSQLMLDAAQTGTINKKSK